MRKSFAAGTFTVICFAAFSLAAPSLISDPSPVKKVALLVIDAGGPAAAPPSPVRLAFHIELEPGWGLYWANPGDAGLAPAVRWALPEGFEAGPLRHPLPDKTDDGGIISFKHKSPVFLLCDITPAPSHPRGGAWEASAVLEWMACRESCVIGEATARVSLPADAVALRRGRTLADALAPRFPRPLSEAGLSAEPARAERSGADWLVTVVLSGPRAGEAVDFFPFPLEGFVINHPGILCRDGRIVVPLTPSRGAGSPPPESISGLVIVDGTGYELSTPVSPPSSGIALTFVNNPSLEVVS